MTAKSGANGMIFKAFCVAGLNVLCQLGIYFAFAPQASLAMKVFFLLSLIFLVLSGYMAFAQKLPRNRPYRSGVLIKKALRQARRGFVLGIVLCMAAWLVQVLALGSAPAFERLAPSFVAYALLWAAVTACAEELLFRGLLMGALVGVFPKVLKTFLAVLLQALLFAYVHMHGVQVDALAVSSFLLAILLAFMALRKRALWMPIGFHCAYDAGLALMSGLHQKHVPDYDGLLLLNGAFPLAVTACLALATAGGAVFMYVRRRSRSNDIFRPASHYGEETTLLMLYFSSDRK